MKPNTALRPAPTAPASPSPSSKIAERRLGLVSRSAQPASTGSAEPLWQPELRSASSIPTTDEVLHAVRPPGTLRAHLEVAIIATATRPLLPQESQQSGNANREREILALFDQLTPIETHDLRRRLEQNRDSDPIAVAFRRLIAERRERLKAHLADPRRRMR